jgi:catalase
VFDLVAILGQKGDPTNDPTQKWDNEDNRAMAPLGKITINAIAPDTTCNAFSFLPGNVADGIAGPSDDPVFAARSPAYTVSLIRRSTPGAWCGQLFTPWSQAGIISACLWRQSGLCI